MSQTMPKLRNDATAKRIQFVLLTSSRQLLLLIICAWMMVRPANGQVPDDPAQVLRNMFETMGKQADGFVPGMFSELNDEEMAELEKVSISVAEENQFGKQVLDNYQASLASRNLSISRTSQAVRYLSQLVKLIVPQMKNAKRYAKLDIAVIETDSIDAYSIPGGHLLFTQGLLDDVESEAELVGVICHELSHLDRGHQLLPLKQAKRTDTMSDFRSSMKWVTMMAKPFRPEFESQADDDAVKWMLAAGYDARELAKLLVRWSQRQEREAGWTKMVPSFARSHPDSGRRAEAVLDAVDRSGVDVDALKIGKGTVAKQINQIDKPQDGKRERKGKRGN